MIFLFVALVVIVVAGLAAGYGPPGGLRLVLRFGVVSEFALLSAWIAAGGTDCGVDCGTTSDVLAYGGLYAGPLALTALTVALALSAYRAASGP